MTPNNNTSITDKSSFNNKVNWDRFLIKSSIIILISLGVFFVYLALFLGKIFPNIYVNNVLLGGKTRKEALSIIEGKYQLDKLNFYYKDKIFEINPDEFEMNIDKEETVNNAYSIGRNKDFLGDIVEQIRLWRTKENLGLEIKYNNESLEEKIASIAAEIDIAAIPSEIYLEKNYAGKKEASISAYKDGEKLNQNEFKNIILDSFKYQDFTNNNLPVEIISEKVEKTQEDYVKNLAGNLIDKKLIIKFEDKIWDLNDEKIINFLSLAKTYNDIKLIGWIKDLGEAVNREPENALFNFNGEKVVEFKTAKNGVELDQGQTIKEMRKGISTLASGEEKEHQIDLVVKETEPEIKNGDANNFGIKELLGKGESWFYHSIASRVHNIELASSKMNGVLVPPGEEFSVLKNVTPIDSVHGYQPAYIIQNGRTLLGDGGGVCQTSTTMFRAALNAGLEILERYPHAYRVSYYEQNYDVGIDASVFEPSADFRFKNDTSAYILVQTSVDKENYYVKYELYGTSDGRKATVGKATIWSQTPPLPSIYQDDPTLPVGTTKQVDWEAWGAKVSFDWKVERNGEIIHENTFWSNYRAWPSIFLKGTKEG